VLQDTLVFLVIQETVVFLVTQDCQVFPVIQVFLDTAEQAHQDIAVLQVYLVTQAFQAQAEHQDILDQAERLDTPD